MKWKQLRGADAIEICNSGKLLEIQHNGQGKIDRICGTIESADNKVLKFEIRGDYNDIGVWVEEPETFTVYEVTTPAKGMVTGGKHRFIDETNCDEFVTTVRTQLMAVGFTEIELGEALKVEEREVDDWERKQAEDYKAEKDDD